MLFLLWVSFRGLGALPSDPACAKSWQVISERVAEAFAFIGLACSHPKLYEQTFSACGLTMAVCSLWPNLQLCQHVQKVVSRCRSAVTDSTAVGNGCCRLKSMSKLTSDLHLWGERSELLYTELKLLTLDVYCIFLKKKKKELLVCELNVRFDILLKHYLTDKIKLYISFDCFCFEYRCFPWLIRFPFLS